MKPIIKIENLSKQYRLGVVGTGTLSNDLKRWWYRTRGKEDPFLKIGETNDRSVKGDSEYVWALKDINLEVMPGEVLGIIGKNGAGKSTLLKILSKVTGPTTGQIHFDGRIGSLLEVGTGFHPELTGRENIFLNGAILGMTKTEIRSKLDEIVDFSGVERYIDTPVKRYSSGMMVRLGFAVAAHLEPEILVVDEVLAVGDAEFQKKAIGKMQDVSANDGRTVLFVSHNMAAIQNLCNRVIVLENGQCFYSGETMKGISKYLNYKIDNSKKPLSKRTDRKGNGIIKIEQINLKNNDQDAVNLQSGCKASFEINFSLCKKAESVIFRLIFVDPEGNIRFVCNNFHSSSPIEIINNKDPIVLEIDSFPLPEGNYFFHAQILVGLDVADEVEYAGAFFVEPGDFFKTGKIPAIRGGVFVKHSWQYHKNEK